MARTMGTTQTIAVVDSSHSPVLARGGDWLLATVTDYVFRLFGKQDLLPQSDYLCVPGCPIL